jgi:hypothetical protein
MHIKLHPWTIPPHILTKHSLREADIYVGSSFPNDAKIYSIAEIGDVYMMECDMAGNPLENQVANLLIKRTKGKTAVIPITHEFLSDITHEFFLDMVNAEIKKLQR